MRLSSIVDEQPASANSPSPRNHARAADGRTRCGDMARDSGFWDGACALSTPPAERLKARWAGAPGSASAAVLGGVVVTVRPAPNSLQPNGMGWVPADGRGQRLLEAEARLPAELGADLRGVDRVAPVVAGPILDEADQAL